MFLALNSYFRTNFIVTRRLMLINVDNIKLLKMLEYVVLKYQVSKLYTICNLKHYNYFQNITNYSVLRIHKRTS